MRRLDGALTREDQPLRLPLVGERATVSALGVHGLGRNAVVLHVETVLGDPDVLSGSAGPGLGPVPRETTEYATFVDFDGGTLEGPHPLTPPTYGTASVARHDDMVWLVHGSCPLHASGFSVT